MSNSDRPATPKTKLEELKARLSQAEEIVVDSEGRLHTPDDPKVVSKPPKEKTVVKPQRWF